MQRSLPLRMSVAVLSSLVALSILAPASSLAQDSPESAVDAVFDALEEQRFDEMGQYVCAAYRDSASDMDSSLTEGLEGLGIDPEAYLDALSINVDERVIETLNRSDSEALVSISAQMTAALDEAVARDLLRTMLADFAQDMTDEQFESIVADTLESMAAGSQLAAEVEVVREDGTWRVCTDLAELMESSASDTEVDSVDAVSADAVCDLISLDELNGLGALQYDSVDASTPGYCSYLSDMETSFHSLGLYIDELSSLDSVKALYGEVMEMRELEVAGRAALSVPDLYSLYVETDRGLLVVIVIADVGEEIGDDYAVAVAEMAVPRWVESEG